MDYTFSPRRPTKENKKTQLIDKCQKNKKNKSGFTLVEVLIAGLLIVMAMASVARFSASAMTASHKQELRRAIEDEIINNMERIQQQDSNLTWESIEENNETTEACFVQQSFNGDDIPVLTGGPANFLQSKLDKIDGKYYVSPPKKLGETNLIREIRASSNAADSMTALIIYRFNTPDFDNTVEQRVLELNPNYAPRCFEL